MTQQISNPLLSFNNDRMAAHTAFRTPSPVAAQTSASAPVALQDTMSIGQAAPALSRMAAPKPTQLDDNQADMALEQVQHNAQDVLAAHNGIDPDRVARLLSLLE